MKMIVNFTEKYTLYILAPHQVLHICFESNHIILNRNPTQSLLYLVPLHHVLSNVFPQKFPEMYFIFKTESP